MDNSESLTAFAVLSANLLRSRIRGIEGKVIASEMPAGGILTTETMVQLLKSKSRKQEWICEVTLKIGGYPKGTPAEQIGQTTPVFSIEVMVQGCYSWDKEPSPKVMKDPSLLHALGRPLYLVAATEARATAVKMGFGGVKPPVDLPRSEAGPRKSMSATKKKPIAPSIDVQDVIEKQPTKAARSKKSTVANSK